MAWYWVVLISLWLLIHLTLLAGMVDALGKIAQALERRSNDCPLAENVTPIRTSDGTD